MTRAFVTGWPVKHSRSPLIHNHWLVQHGIDGSYEKQPCDPDDFTSFISGFQNEGFVGGNVTLPYKEQTFALADEVDKVAKAVGAANTVWHENGKLHATNTDVYGFLANLDQQVPGWGEPERQRRGALILGAGGASRAIIYGLLERGFENITIANRTVSKAQNLARAFGHKCVAAGISALSDECLEAALIVNTTSIGMGDGQRPVDPSLFAKDAIVNDIVYAPLVTPLLATAKEAGMLTIDGLGMLLHQAVPGFERWFGVRPEVTDELRGLVLTDLGESA